MVYLSFHLFLSTKLCERHFELHLERKGSRLHTTGSGINQTTIKNYRGKKKLLGLVYRMHRNDQRRKLCEKKCTPIKLTQRGTKNKSKSCKVTSH